MLPVARQDPQRQKQLAPVGEPGRVAVDIATQLFRVGARGSDGLPELVWFKRQGVSRLVGQWRKGLRLGDLCHEIIKR